MSFGELSLQKRISTMITSTFASPFAPKLGIVCRGIPRSRLVQTRMGFVNSEPLTFISEGPQPSDSTKSARLWMSTRCPFAQRVWIAVNYKGLNNAIQLVNIDLTDKPVWYKNVYPANKVPALEHENKITGESLDLLHFDGLKLIPEDKEGQGVAQDLLKHADSLVESGYKALRGLELTQADAEELVRSDLDFLETTLENTSARGPFFLGEKIGLGDNALAPFLERFKVLLGQYFQLDITAGRPNLKRWLTKWTSSVPILKLSRIHRI